MSDWSNGQSQIIFDEYKNWAKQHSWDLFVTLTFGKRTSHDLAREKFRKWVRAIEKHEKKKGQTSYYMAVEFNRAGAHIHALAHNIRDIAFARKWWQKNCGKCRISLYNADQDGVGYVTKVVHSGGVPDPWGPIWRMDNAEV
jgi:hypothetical protein